MIAFIEGITEYIEDGYAVLNVGGVGYRVFMSPFNLSKLAVGETARVHTFLKVAEDIFQLYGFLSRDELNMFKQIISVSGAGPKAGLAILSVLSPQEFALCVVTDDYKSITKAQGVGPKLAQKLCLELRDKVKNEDMLKTSQKNESSPSSFEMGGQEAAISALLALGYTQGEAVRAITNVEKGLGTEETIKSALRYLASRGSF